MYPYRQALKSLVISTLDVFRYKYQYAHYSCLLFDCLITLALLLLFNFLFIIIVFLNNFYIDYYIFIVGYGWCDILRP